MERFKQLAALERWGRSRGSADGPGVGGEKGGGG